MWLERSRFQLRMELHANEPGMIVILDDFRQDPVWRHTGKTHAPLLEAAFVGRVDLIAMAVALGDFGRAIDMRHPASALQDRIIGAKPHGAAEVTARGALLQFIAL